MKKPKILFFCANAQLIEQIQNLIPVQFELIPLAPNTATDLPDGTCLVLLHHQPPFYSVYEKLNNLQKIYPRLNTIVLSANSIEKDAIKIFKSGARDYLKLPFQEDEFINSVKKYSQSFNWSESFIQKVLNFFSGNKRQPGFSQPSVISTKNSIFSDQNSISKPLIVPDLKVQLFGNFQLFLGEKKLQTLKRRKTRALMAYLLHKHPMPIHRDFIMDKFWSGVSQDSSRNSLNVAMYHLRKDLDNKGADGDYIIYENGLYSIHKDLIIEKDVDFFRDCCRKGEMYEKNQNMEAAISYYHQSFSFYKGDFLEDMRDEEWAEREREKLRETYLIIMDRLSLHFMKNKDFHQSIWLCKRMLEKDGCLEEIHRRLMYCFHQLGNRNKAIRQFQKCQEVLFAELEMKPSHQTLKMLEEIRGRRA